MQSWLIQTIMNHFFKQDVAREAKKFLLDFAREAAKKTETEFDDIGVDIMEKILEYLISLIPEG